MRRSMAEAVQNYPNVEDQRAIIDTNFAKIEHPPPPQALHERFQHQLGKSLAESTNRAEFKSIMKQKLLQIVKKDPRNPQQDHLKLLDHFMHGDIVKQLTMPKPKHYMSSSVTDALEELSGRSVQSNNKPQSSSNLLRRSVHHSVSGLERLLTSGEGSVSGRSNMAPPTFRHAHTDLSC